MTDLPANSALIIPRRNFLVRALGFTAAGAAVTVPIVEVASAEQRFEHHVRGVEAAMRDLFPGADIGVRGNCRAPSGQAVYRKAITENPGEVACMIFLAAQRLA